MKLFKQTIAYILLFSMICTLRPEYPKADIMSTNESEYNTSDKENKNDVMSTNKNGYNANDDTIINVGTYDDVMLTLDSENSVNNDFQKNTQIIEEDIVEEDISLDEFRDVLETSYERLSNNISVMSTYKPGERTYSPSCRDQLDEFSKEIYDGLVDFTESGKMLYGTESGTESVSANSVLIFEYQSKEEAEEKIAAGRGIKYEGTSSQNQFLYNTAYLAFAAFKWDNPEIYYLDSNAFKFSLVGQDETTTILKYSENEKYFGRIVVTIEVANEKNGGKKKTDEKNDPDYGERYYYNSFINSAYENKILNPNYGGEDKNTVNNTKYIYNPEATKEAIVSENAIIEKNKKKAYSYVDETIENASKDKELTKEERDVLVVNSLNKWVCDNTYYNKYETYTSKSGNPYATDKRYEMSSVLSDLLPANASPKEGLTGKGDINAPICEGYSKAMKYMLSEYDIPAVLIAGYTRKTSSTYSGNHMWNGVLIGDIWYALDTTWNESHNDSSYTLVGNDSVIHSSAFKDNHYPLGTFWGQNVGKINFPTLSSVSYGEKQPEIPVENPVPNSFYVKGDNVYYYDARLKKVTGFKTINGRKYYFNPSKTEGEDEYGSLKSGFFNVGKSTYYRDGRHDTDTEFTGISKGYVLLSSDMSDITREKEGYYYFNNSTGVMLKGFQNVTLGTGKTAKKVRFYFDETGKKSLGSNRKLIVNGKTYFVNTDGSMMSGLIKLAYTSGAVRLYYASNYGQMMTGYKTVIYPESMGGDGKRCKFYFKTGTGEAARSEIIKAGAKVTYFNNNYETEKLDGFVEFNSDYYYFKNSPYAITGFADITLNYNYVDELENEKVAIRKYRYYFDKDTGKMAVGFTKIANKMYYFSEDPYFADESSTGTKGKMETGIVTIPECSKDYIAGNTNTFYMLKNGGMFTNGLVTATKEFGIKDSQKFEYYFSDIDRTVNGINVRMGEAVGGYLSFDGKKLLKASNTYSKNTPYHFDEKTGARRRMILYYHGGYFGLPVSDIQRDVMKSISSYGDADLNFGNNDIIFATMSDDYPVCASSYIPEEKRGQAVDMDGKALSNDSRVIYNPANDYVNYDGATKTLTGGITGIVSNDVNEYGSNLKIVPGIKEYTYIEKSRIPDEEDIKYTVSFNVLNVERGNTIQSYVNNRYVYNFEGEIVKNEDFITPYKKAVNSESDGIVNVFDVESYCKATYKWCIDEYGKENVVLVGASSGAGICMSLIQWAAEIDKDLVAESTVLISPWLDASMAVATKDDKKRKGGGVDYETLCYWGKRYTNISKKGMHSDKIYEDGYDDENNYYIDYSFASPVTVSERQNRNYVNLGNIYVFTGTKDACMNNGMTLSKLCLKKSGTRIAYKCYSNESHGFVFNVNDSNSRYVINLIANLKAIGL